MLQADSTVVYVYSNANNDAHYYGQGLFEALSIIAKGELPPGAVGDWVREGVRIKGSKASGTLNVKVPLVMSDRGQLVDHDPAVHTVAPIVKTPIRSLVLDHDNCVDQFKGANGVRVTQQLGLEARRRVGHDVAVHDSAGVPEHGKDKADGAKSPLQAAVQNARRAGITAEDSSVASRAIFVEAARSLQRPSTPRALNPALFAHTNYVHGFLPDTFAAPEFTAVDGHDGSSRDFYHRPHPANRLATDAWTVARLQPCFCATCLAGNMVECLVPDLVANNEPRAHQLPRSSDLPVVARARKEATTAHAAKLQQGLKVVVRVDPRDEMVGGRALPCHVALVLSREPFTVSKNTATKTNGIKRGKVVVKTRWFHRAPARDRPTEHAYELPEGEMETSLPQDEVWPVDCTVPSCHAAVQHLRLDKENGVWYMPSEAHTQIMATSVDLLAQGAAAHGV